MPEYKSEKLHSRKERLAVHETFLEQNSEYLNQPVVDGAARQMSMPAVKRVADLEEKGGFKEEAYYSQRSMFTDTQQMLISSLWRGKDSTSMKNVKNAIGKLAEFHAKPVLNEAQLSRLKSYEDRAEGYRYAIGQLKASVQEYVRITNELADMCHAYISSHHPHSGPGQQRLEMVKVLKDMAVRDAVQFRLEADGIFNDQGQDFGELDALIKGGNWETIFSEARNVRGLLQSDIADGAKEVEYNNKKFVVKTQKKDSIYEMNLKNAMKTTASYAVSKYLGIDDAFAETYNLDCKGDNIIFIQEEVKGAKLSDVGINNLPVHYSDLARKQMSNIAIFDMLSGYLNRKGDNIIADYAHKRLPDGTEYMEVKAVKTVDNDSAFSSVTGANELKGGAGNLCSPENINYIDRGLFNSIMSLDDSTIRFITAGSMMDENSYRAARERLDLLRNCLIEKYQEKGAALFRLPDSADKLISVKRLEGFAKDGGVDSLLSKTDASLDERIKEAEKAGADIQEIKGERRIEEMIDFDFEMELGESEGLEQQEEQVSIAFDFEAEEQQEPVQQEPALQQVEEEEEERLEQVEEKEIEHEDEIEIQQQSANQVLFHMPDGNELHEKYRSQREGMKFEGMSYYSQRSKLTEKELDMGKNLSKLGNSDNVGILRNMLDDLHRFHTSPVLTDEQRGMVNFDDPKTYKLLGQMMKESAATYSRLANALDDELKKYITTHVAKTQNGREWIKTLKSVRVMLKRDSLAFAEEVDNIIYNIGEEISEVKNILNGGNWLNILSVSRSISGAKMIKFTEGNGVSQTTTKYEYKGKKYFRKKVDPNNGIGNPMNSVGSYRVSTLLGTDDIYVSAFRMREYDVSVTDENDSSYKQDSNEKYGIIMETARGTTLRALHKNKNANGIIYSDEAKKQFSRLMLTDFICGQTDRKDDNIMADAELRTLEDGRKCWYVKSIQAIDSDQSIVTTQYLPDLQDGLLFSVCIKLLQYVDKEFYERLENMDVDSFTKAVEYSIMDCDANEQTAGVLGKRLEYVQGLLRHLHQKNGDKLFEMPKHANDVIMPHRTKWSVMQGAKEYKNISYFLAWEMDSPQYGIAYLN